MTAKKTKIYLYCVDYCWGRGHNDVIGYALTEDGVGLASHLSSNREWAQHDMGLTSDWKHDHYAEHCPDGYELEWVDDVENHPGLQAAIRINHQNASRNGD